MVPFFTGSRKILVHDYLVFSLLSCLIHSTRKCWVKFIRVWFSTLLATADSLPATMNSSLTFAYFVSVALVVLMLINFADADLKRAKD